MVDSSSHWYCSCGCSAYPVIISYLHLALHISLLCVDEEIFLVNTERAFWPHILTVFSRQSVKVDIRPLVKPSLEASWSEQILLTPIKPKLFPHSAILSNRRRPSEIMTCSLNARLDGLTCGLQQHKVVRQSFSAECVWGWCWWCCGACRWRLMMCWTRVDVARKRWMHAVMDAVH